MSPDDESAWLLGQHCANAVLDRRQAQALDELTAVYNLLDTETIVPLSPCTYATLAGYRDTLADYVRERSDL